MFKVLNCIATAHDLRLVFLAAALCSVATFAGLTLLRHARNSRDNQHSIWLLVSAVSTGFGIWGTHFIGMLSFEPGLPTAYNVDLTIISLVVAVLLTGLGFFIAISADRTWEAGIGGIVVAGGVACMHYLGMAAFEIQGYILWNVPFVISSIVVAAAFGAVALPIGLHGTRSPIFGGSAFLTLAICSHHFTAMSAVSIIPDPTHLISMSAIPAAALAIVVAVVSMAIVGLALAGIAVDLREKRRSAREIDRLRALADAAVEGLIVCNGSTIVTVNKSFATMMHVTSEELIGGDVSSMILNASCLIEVIDFPGAAIETEFTRVDGSKIPAELVSRPIDFAGTMHHAIAVRDLTDRRVAAQHIHFLAHHDALTGLANRTELVEKLDGLLSSSAVAGLAVHFIDLDRFKHINDTLGHENGDVVLKMIAERLVALAGSQDLVARLGGDEFVVVQRDVLTECAEDFARRISHSLSTPLVLGGLTVSTTVSVGIAMAQEGECESKQILQSAELALYEARMAGDCIRFYTAELDQAIRDRVDLEYLVRDAVSSDGFELYYQPLFKLAGRKLQGFEALVRLPKKDGSLISPAVFIPLAEELKLISQIGTWVLREACRTAATWPNHLTVAVNLSPAQFAEGNIAAVVAEILKSTELDPRRLELEITESLLLGDDEAVMAQLKELKQLGVAIAMDDFGTGYSSLSYLWRFPFDKIKLDQSFMRGFDGTGRDVGAIVKTIIGLGKELKIRVTVEGVETAQQAMFLEGAGGDQVQGYLFGKPAPASALGSMILEDFQRSHKTQSTKRENNRLQVA
jgi:diguanylate cyclase (GGDEF)-like protein/PAS domain S-box-containing protein